MAGGVSVAVAMTYQDGGGVLVVLRGTAMSCSWSAACSKTSSCLVSAAVSSNILRDKPIIHLPVTCAFSHVRRMSGASVLPFQV